MTESEHRATLEVWLDDPDTGERSFHRNLCAAHFEAFIFAPHWREVWNVRRISPSMQGRCESTGMAFAANQEGASRAQS